MLYGVAVDHALKRIGLRDAKGDEGAGTPFQRREERSGAAFTRSLISLSPQIGTLGAAAAGTILRFPRLFQPAARSEF